MAFLGTFWLSRVKIWRNTKSPGHARAELGPAPGTGGLKAPAWPGTHRCRAAGTARTPRSGPWRVTVPAAPPPHRAAPLLRAPVRSPPPPPPPASRALIAARARLSRTFSPVRAGRPTLAAARSSPADACHSSMQISWGQGSPGEKGGGGEDDRERRRGESRGWGAGAGVGGVGPAAPRGWVPSPPGAGELSNTPFNCQGSVSNGPLV